MTSILGEESRVKNELLLKVKKIVKDSHKDQTSTYANFLMNEYKTSKKHYLNQAKEKFIIMLRKENEKYYKLITTNQKAKEEFKKFVDKKATELAVIKMLISLQVLGWSNTQVQLEFFKLLESTDREALQFALASIGKWQPPQRFQEQKEHDVERDLWRQSHDF